jgi:hypothetical protein
MHWLRIGIALMLPCLALGLTRAQDKPTVTVKLAKLPELDKIIQSHKGKVVIVDVWSTT